MEYTIKNGGVSFKCPPFDLMKTFGCGQAFRFTMDDNGQASGIAFGMRLEAVAEEDGAFLRGVGEDDFLSVWASYFSLYDDYGEIERALATDQAMKEAIGAGRGIRLLKQEPWEAACSFVLSQNSNIPRIRKMVEALSRAFGERKEDKAGDYYCFPTPKQILSGESLLSGLGLGYRDRYVYSLASEASEGAIDFESLKSAPIDEAREELMKVRGIGAKVADCILLFGLCRYEAWPQDVWIKRTLSNIYGVKEKEGRAFAKAKWGGACGIAQQYLYYSEREKAGVGLKAINA